MRISAIGGMKGDLNDVVLTRDEGLLILSLLIESDNELAESLAQEFRNLFFKSGEHGFMMSNLENWSG